MKKYIVIVLMLIGQLALFGQNPCEIYFETKTTTANTIEIDVKANGFTNVFGYQMYVKWDSTVLKYNSITYSHPELVGMLFSTDLGANILSSGWSAVLQTKTFPDATTLFTVKYDYEGDPCDETTLALTDPDQFRKSLIIYSDGDDEAEFPLNFIENVVQIPGTDCGSGGENNGFGLLINDEIAAKGSIVCVPIKVDSFVNIQALQYSVCWDKTILSWQGEENNWAAAQGANALSNVLGDSVYYYLMDSPTPLNLSDGSILVELCFEVLGDNGDVSSVEFCDALPFEATDANSNSLDYYNVDGSVTVGDIDNAVTFILSNETSDQNKEVCVDVTAKNFNAIESFQYVVEWDPNIMTWKGLGPVNNINIIYNPLGGGHISQSGNNKINVSWDSAFGDTEPDDGILFQLCYDVVGNCNERTDIDIIGDVGLPIEVTSNGVVLPHIEVTGSVEIKCQIPPPVINIVHIDCNGKSTGRIDVLVEGNPNDYNFNWSDAATGPSRNGIKAGTYIVTISDKNDPTISIERTIIVTEPDLLEMTSVVDNETCIIKGYVNLTVTGGTTPYTYEWSNGGSTKQIANLDAGDYTVTVTDANDCDPIIRSFTVELIIPELVVEMSSMTEPICFGAEDGTLTISASGGCLPYEIIWSDGKFPNSLSRTDMAAGDISVTVTDSKDQEMELDFTFTNPDKALAITNNIVVTGNPASIDITVEGGEKDYTFSWTGPDFTASTEDINNIDSSGTYIVVVTDARGCEITKSFEVIVIITNPEMEVFVDNKKYSNYGIKCNGECNGSIDATINANVPWEIFLDGDKITLPYDEVCGGEHTLKMVDKEGYEVEVVFTVSEPEPLTVELDEFTCSNDGKDDGTISVNVDGGAGDYTFDWGVSGTDDYIIENLPKGTYAVSVSDENDCVVVSEDIKVPNCDRSDCYQGSLILTPNGDEFNEYFLVRCFDDFESNELNVYDRLGNKVYTQAAYDGTWNGVDSDGNELLEDSYMWVFIGVTENGVKEVYKGTVTILR